MPEISRALVAWFSTHQRDLPWRHTRDAYAIWVSETMLQQTQAATVVGYYKRFLDRFPTLADLARARETDVLHAWQGLGYYSRARRLQAAARRVVDDFGGKLPEEAHELQKLPGIGPYSAGAIASIAFNRDAPIVDGNVIRVVSRLFALRGNPHQPRLRKKYWDLAGALILSGRARESNQALMELGATVCSPKRPNCPACPVRAHCQARARGLTDQLPALPKRPATIEEQHVVAVVERKRRVLVVRARESDPRWAGLWQFPNAIVRPRESPHETLDRLLGTFGLHSCSHQSWLTLKHTITRHRITLGAYRSEAAGTARSRQAAELIWQHRDELKSLALPTPHRRLAQALSEANR